MTFLLIFIVTAIVQFFTPWWTIALVPFLIALWRPDTGFKSFVISFAAIALLWFFYGFYLHINSEGAMSNRIAEIFSLPGGLPLLAVTTIIGGLVGGFAGLAGSLTRQAFNSKI